MLAFFERSSKAFAVKPAGQKFFLRIFLAKFLLVPTLKETNDRGKRGLRLADINFWQEIASGLHFSFSTMKFLIFVSLVSGLNCEIYKNRSNLGNMHVPSSAGFIFSIISSFKLVSSVAAAGIAEFEGRTGTLFKTSSGSGIAKSSFLDFTLCPTFGVKLRLRLV